MQEPGLSAAEYEELVTLLERRLAVIGDAALRESDPDEQLRQLQAASEAIEAFHSDNRDRIPFRLRHFLERASLDKALAFAREAGSKTA